MPLIPNDDPEALAELLGYLDEIGYGELYLGRAPGAASMVAASDGGGEVARAVGELALAARDAGLDADGGQAGRREAGPATGGEARTARREAAAGQGAPAGADADPLAGTGADGEPAAARAAALAA